MRLHEARTGSLHRVLIAGAGEGVCPVMLTMRWKATPTAWSTTARDPRVTVDAGGWRSEAMWLLFATTGMRRGEVARLAWGDVDLLAAQVRITRTLGVVQNKPTWKLRPKSAAGERLMALDPMTIQALREHRKRQTKKRLLVGSAWQRRQNDWRGELNHPGFDAHLLDWEVQPCRRSTTRIPGRRRSVWSRNPPGTTPRSTRPS